MLPAAFPAPASTDPGNGDLPLRSSCVRGSFHSFPFLSNGRRRIRVQNDQVRKSSCSSSPNYSRTVTLLPSFDTVPRAKPAALAHDTPTLLHVHPLSLLEGSHHVARQEQQPLSPDHAGHAGGKPYHTFTRSGGD